MKTLVIHPKDRTTDFLKPIYKNIPNTTVLTEGLKSDVLKLIEEHDRILMMGHGSPGGLFGVGRFRENNYYSTYVIDRETVSALLPKKENVFIWCNADQFVKQHELKGFYSGMFISEVSEASICGLRGVPQSVVDESNDSFAQWLGNVSHLPVKEAYYQTLDKYEILAESNSVAKYNSLRLYLAE